MERRIRRKDRMRLRENDRGIEEREARRWEERKRGERQRGGEYQSLLQRSQALCS